MMKNIYLFVCIVILSFGCSKENLLNRKEDKLVGVWEFEKVYYKADNNLFRENITDAYRNDQIEFFDNFTARYDDSSLQAMFDGDWHLFLDRDVYHFTDGTSKDVEFFVDAAFYDYIHREQFELFGAIDKLNSNKLHLEGRDRYGAYTYKLCRR